MVLFQVAVDHELEDQNDILGSIVEAGNQGNFTFSAPFAPGLEVVGQFSPYSIPDRLVIKDEIKTYYDSGVASGTGIVVSFTVDENSSGNMVLEVFAPQAGTAWDFSLRQLQSSTQINSQDMRLPFSFFLGAATLVGLSSVDAVASNLPSFQIVTNKTSIIEEGDVRDTPGSGFFVSRSDASGSVDIGWRIVGIGANPVDAADFYGEILPEGTLNLGDGISETPSVSFGFTSEGEAPGPFHVGVISDAVSEGVETLAVELFDLSTRAIIVAAGSATTFHVFDDYFFYGPIEGDDSDNEIEGTSLDDVIVGRGGNDTINGFDGNDQISAGNANDYIDAGRGSDWIDAGFGDDIIIGGEGVDTLGSGPIEYVFY